MHYQTSFEEFNEGKAFIQRNIGEDVSGFLHEIYDIAKNYCNDKGVFFIAVHTPLSTRHGVSIQIIYKSLID